MSQVQVLVHVRAADQTGKPHFELFDVETHTSILQIKQQVNELPCATFEASLKPDLRGLAWRCR